MPEQTPTTLIPDHWTAAELTEDRLERAAILEIEAGVPRDEAWRLAGQARGQRA